jgi:hypothetical protein
MDRCVVYWLHTDVQHDVWTEGYVGVTCNLKVRRKWS